MPWILLAGAIALEVFATTMLKLSAGFSRLLPSIGVVAGYLGAFVLLAFVLKTLPVGTIYALWAGLGTALVAVVGVLAFAEPLTAPKVGGIVLIIGGVVMLNLSGAH
ncbi:MAG: QacE family quaternary ammonium compound efflux SMR transporter [Pseudonocardiaceae bacterium]|nr:QacE family quaternary ammonium compound efflux SMR transporter [Pseudonocardiaceae bacterium]